MKSKIKLQDLLDSNFRFYLDRAFIGKVISLLKQKYKTFSKMAEELEIDMRNLYSVRRGYEYWKDKKVIHFISSDTLKVISNTSSIPLSEFENNVVMIKSGFGGQRDRIKLPIEVELESENITSLKRSLAEYMYIKNLEVNILKRSNVLDGNFIKENGYIKINPHELSKKLKKQIIKMEQRGLNPTIKSFEQMHLLKFTNIRNHQIAERIIPSEVLIDETFAREFGKWMGDNAFSDNAIAVVNKNWNFISEFQKFLNSKLLQPKNQIQLYLSIKEGFQPSKELLTKTTKIRKTSQEGDYAFITGVYNKLLRNFIFDPVFDKWYDVLLNSNAKVRFGFYSGLFEADGSFDIRSRIALWSFGLNLKNGIDQNKITNLLEKVVMFKHLLSIDGFQPNISRKIAKTAKSFILKYDVTIMRNKITRDKDIKIFRNNILPYLTHEDKMKTFYKVMESN